MQGTLLGNYRVTEQLGQGGMGVVYVGRHEQLGHRVAVKVLRAEMSRNETMLRRFFNEAQAATAIRNPGIVQVFDFGTTPDGYAYFVMELLEGASLSARLKERPLEVAECCRIARQIANVLQSAHDAGITHRDLKPDNLFLVPDPEVIGGERVKVLDFGIAKLAGEVHAGGVHTRADIVMGTPSYMAPEQCRGAGAVDTRADIYSLGCVLFKMVCGRAPFVSEGAGDIIGAHLYLPPPSLLELVPHAPHALAQLVARTLEKHPDARPQTMAAVSQALDDILRELAGPARPSAELPAVGGPAPGAAGASPVSALAAAAPPYPHAAAAPAPISAMLPAQHPAGGVEPPRLPGPGGIPASAPLSMSTGSVPASGPRPAQLYDRATGAPAGPPTLTTLGGAAGVSSVQVRPDARRPWALWLLGGLVLCGAAVAVTIVLARDAGPDAGARQMSFSEIESQSAAGKVVAGAAGAAVTVGAAAQQVPAPPPPAAPPPPPPTAGSAAAAATPGDLEAECKGLQVDRKWAELARCADKLAPTSPGGAAELKARAAAELKAQPRIAALEAALRDHNLRRARAELEQIGADSVELPRLKARYDEAERWAVNELSQRLERAVTPDCAEHRAILAKERAAQPTRVLDLAARRAPCQPISRTQCDARKLADEAEQLHRAGKLTAALTKLDESWYCKPDPKVAKQGFVIACIMPSAQRAKQLWKRLPADVRPTVITHCANNGISQQQLDAP